MSLTVAGQPDSMVSELVALLQTPPADTTLAASLERVHHVFRQIGDTFTHEADRLKTDIIKRANQDTSSTQQVLDEKLAALNAALGQQANLIAEARSQNSQKQASLTQLQAKADAVDTSITSFQAKAATIPGKKAHAMSGVWGYH